MPSSVPLSSAFPEQRRTSSWLPWLFVAPDRRRRGIGRALLGAAVQRAAAEGRSRIGFRTPVDDEAGARWARAIGAAATDQLEQNRLATGELDRALLESWVARAAERATDYTLVGWDGPCPDELVVRFAAVQTVMDDAPNARPPDDRPTVARVRAAEAYWLPRGPYWRVCAMHRPSGELVGMTELQLPAARPWLADQGDTGVHVDHRRRGIGRWLKTATALRLLDEQPQVRIVDTWNGATNTDMLAINRAMGFRPVERWQSWERTIAPVT